MYATLEGKCKPSKSVSTDKTRPILNNAELRETADGWEIVSCDSYQMARVPVTVKEDNENEPLTAGPISSDALKAIEKAGGFRANGNIAPCNAYGHPTGQTFARQDVGTFPNWDEVTPAEPVEQDQFVIGLNPKLLYALSQSLGANKTVFLRVDLSAPTGGNGCTRPSFQGKPIMVSADGGSNYNGVLMPVRPNR